MTSDPAAGARLSFDDLTTEALAAFVLRREAELAVAEEHAAAGGDVPDLEARRRELEAAKAELVRRVG